MNKTLRQTERLPCAVCPVVGVDPTEGSADEDAERGGVPERRAGPGPVPGRVGQVPGSREEKGGGGPRKGERSGLKYTGSRL